MSQITLVVIQIKTEKNSQKRNVLPLYDSNPPPAVSNAIRCDSQIEGFLG